MRKPDKANDSEEKTRVLEKIDRNRFRVEIQKSKGFQDYKSKRKVTK